MNNHTIRHVASVTAVVLIFLLLAALALAMSGHVLAAAAPHPLVVP